MDLFQAIHGRRSIRSYTDEKVSKEDLKKILSAGMSAPSAMDCQTWRFVVLETEEARKKAASLNEYAFMAEKAPLSILVCGDEDVEKIPGYWPVDCSACIQNMLLATHALGLGGVWTGIYPSEERMKSFASAFSLPKNLKPHSLIVIGHPKKTKESKDGYDEDKVRYGVWS